MEYSLYRYEKNKDHAGEIVSIFIALSISQGEESVSQEYWLTEEERAEVLKDESTLQTILERVAAEGEERLEKTIAEKPQEPIIHTKDELKKFEIRVTEVEKHKKERKDKKDKLDIKES